MAQSPKVCSIFCGCGGLDLGFREAGFDLVYACDFDATAVDCYRHNVDPRVFQTDVLSSAFDSDLNALRGVDVVLGGFPCQGFSKAGPKRRTDGRNSLYLRMRDAVRKLRPSIFVAENVDGILQNFKGAFVEQIVGDFLALGYRVDYRLLNALAFGVAQHRRRVVFVGVRDDSPLQFRWPVPTHESVARNGEFAVPEQRSLFDCNVVCEGKLRPPLTIRDAIGDLVDLGASVPDHVVTNAWPKSYEAIFAAIGPGQKLCNVRHSSTSVYTWHIPEAFGAVSHREKVILEVIATNRRHKEYGNIPNGNPLPVEEIERISGLSAVWAEIESLQAKGYLKRVASGFDLKGAMFCSGMFKRPEWTEPSPTVLTNFHNPRYFLHPLQNRPFSLRECARLQGFPDTFRFSSGSVDVAAGYKLVGNAVPPPMSRAIAASVKHHLMTLKEPLVSERHGAS